MRVKFHRFFRTVSLRSWLLWDGLHIQNMYSTKRRRVLNTTVILHPSLNQFLEGVHEERVWWTDKILTRLNDGFSRLMRWWNLGKQIVITKPPVPSWRTIFVYFLIREPDSKIWPQKIWVRWIGMQFATRWSLTKEMAKIWLEVTAGQKSGWIP